MKPYEKVNWFLNPLWGSVSLCVKVAVSSANENMPIGPLARLHQQKSSPSVRIHAKWDRARKWQLYQRLRALSDGQRRTTPRARTGTEAGRCYAKTDAPRPNEVQ